MREFLDLMLKKEGYKVSLASMGRGLKLAEGYLRFDSHGYPHAQVRWDFRPEKVRPFHPETIVIMITALPLPIQRSRP